MKRVAVLCATVLSLAACGSSDGVKATASSGDAFCKLAATAKADNDALDAVDPADTAKVKVVLTAGIDSLAAAVAKAPKDIAGPAKELLAEEERLEKLLKDNGYDFTKVGASAEGKKFIDDVGKSTADDDFKTYLNDKCGIVTDTTDDTAGDTSGDTTPVDTTPLQTAPADSTAGDASSSGTLVDFGEGEAAINKFLDLYEAGTGSTLSGDERDCLVTALVDKISGDDLNQAINGEASDELSQTLGQAFIGCNVDVLSS